LEKKIPEYFNFDSAYQEVDWILDSSELFPVLHPKKSSQMINTPQYWMIQVMKFLINFKYKDINYGVPFLYLNNLVQNWDEFQYKLDFSIVLNWVYLEHYKEWHYFWRDLLKVLDIYNQLNKFQENEDQSVLLYRMKQLIIFSYQQWIDVLHNDHWLFNEFL
jgi:hypothetical protein